MQLPISKIEFEWGVIDVSNKVLEHTGRKKNAPHGDKSIFYTYHKHDVFEEYYVFISR